MKNEIIIDIQRTGFPVKVGKVELWFDSSLESLRRFFNIEEIVQKKLTEAEEKIQHIHFPEEVTVENVGSIEGETIDAAMDFNKESIAVQYDVIFGEGTFEKVYDVYPDIFALEKALEVVSLAISKRVEELEFERTERIEDIKTKYLNKKSQKK